MVHQLCSRCIHHCKQEDSVKIVQCPRFQKRLTDDEFKDLIDQLREMENDVTSLKKRTEALIETALSRGTGPVTDGDNCDEEDEPE